MMSDILERIIACKRREIEQWKSERPLTMLAQETEKTLDTLVQGGSMRKSLMGAIGDYGIISEFKRRSPSKGWIKEGADASVIPMGYQQNGASALSILTDGGFFGGSDSDIIKARASGVELPVLYKNFIIDEYQLFQARKCGASAVLLIAACLTRQECQQLMTRAHNLGLEVLLEMHSAHELAYAELEPDMYGINNRNLGTFITDVENSLRMADVLPKNVCKVSESGISDAAVIRSLAEAGFQGFLIGERFMKEDNPGVALGQFIAEI